MLWFQLKAEVPLNDEVKLIIFKVTRNMPDLIAVKTTLDLVTSNYTDDDNC